MKGYSGKPVETGHTLRDAGDFRIAGRDYRYIRLYRIPVPLGPEPGSQRQLLYQGIEIAVATENKLIDRMASPAERDGQ